MSQPDQATHVTPTGKLSHQTRTRSPMMACSQAFYVNSVTCLLWRDAIQAGREVPASLRVNYLLFITEK